MNKKLAESSIPVKLSNEGQERKNPSTFMALLFFGTGDLSAGFILW